MYSGILTFQRYKYDTTKHKTQCTISTTPTCFGIEGQSSGILRKKKVTNPNTPLKVLTAFIF